MSHVPCFAQDLARAPVLLALGHISCSRLHGVGAGGGGVRMVSEVNLSANVGAGDNSRV